MTVHRHAYSVSASSTDETTVRDRRFADNRLPWKIGEGSSYVVAGCPLRCDFIDDDQLDDVAKSARARARELTFLSLFRLFYFFSPFASRTLSARVSLSFLLSIPRCVFRPSSYTPDTGAARRHRHYRLSLPSLLSLSHTRLLRSTVLSLTLSHRRGCEKSSVGPNDWLSLSLSIRDDDDDRWGRPMSGSILTACVYALVYRVLLLLYTHPSRRPSRPFVLSGTMSKFCRKNRPSAASRDSFSLDWERGRLIYCVTIGD